ncbi:MAG: prophage regulatory protein [Marivirga sp.]|jgi:prophage regulatory protein
MSNEAQAQALPTTGFIRLPTIIGNPKSNPPIPPLIPVCKSSWWAGVKSGIYPKPIKIGRSTAWKAEDIRKLITQLGS